MTQPLLSVITACFGHGRYVRESMESVLRQTEPNIELVFIDDGGTDDAWSIAMGVAGRDERVRVISNDRNRGLAYSQNVGIRAARAPWVLKVDADDYIEPDYVAEILAAAAADPLRNIIYSPAHMFGNVDRVYTYKPFVAARMIDSFMIPGPAAFLKAIWEAVGGYDETMRSAEDWDLYVRAQQVVGLMPHQLSRPLWHYREHSGTRASHHGIARLPHLQTYWREHTRESVLARSRNWAAWCAERQVAA